MDLPEAKFVSRYKDNDNTLNTKANEVMVSQLKDKIKLLKSFKSNYEKAILMKEFYDKQLKVLIHGIQEYFDNAWENRDKNN